MPPRHITTNYRFSLSCEKAPHFAGPSVLRVLAGNYVDRARPLLALADFEINLLSLVE